jgi:xanthosine utilization system XapX-like protein
MSLVLGGMLMVFLAFPISRTSNLFLAGLVGSFAGGIIIQLAADQYNLLLLTACSFAIAWGVTMIPVLNILGRLNQRLSEDDAVVDSIYQWLKEKVARRVDKVE